MRALLQRYRMWRKHQEIKTLEGSIRYSQLQIYLDTQHIQHCRDEIARLTLELQVDTRRV